MPSPVLRSWVAFAAIGTAVLHLALVIGAPLPLAIVLVPLGAAEFGWGMLTLARSRIIAPQVARVVALVPTGRYLVGLVSGALVILSLTAPSLAVTQAGLTDSRSSHNFGPMGSMGH